MSVEKVNVVGKNFQDLVTMLVNWLVGIGCIAFYNRLNQFDHFSWQKWDWAVFFLLLGISFFSGGIAHYISEKWDMVFHMLTWIITNIAVLFAELGSILIVKSVILKNLLITGVIIQFIVVTLLTIQRRKFSIILINSLIGFLFLTFSIHFTYFLHNGFPGNGLIAGGIISLIVPFGIFQKKVTLAKWLNYIDFSHLLMLGCLYLIFLGCFMLVN